MKPLDKIFTPDITSLDPAIGPALFVKKSENGKNVPATEEEYVQYAIARHHSDIAKITCFETVPAHIQKNIELSKNLLLYSFYVFDFTTAAVHYAQIALEASLRRVLGKSEDCRDNINMMMKEALSRNILSITNYNEALTIPGFISKSRNGFAHGKENQSVYNQAIAIPFVEAMLSVINTLFSGNHSNAT